MTDVAAASATPSKLRKPTPLVRSGIPKLVTQTQSQSPSVKPSRLPVSRPVSRSISATQSANSGSLNVSTDDLNPPNTPTTPSSGSLNRASPLMRRVTSSGRPSTASTPSYARTTFASTTKLPVATSPTGIPTPSKSILKKPPVSSRPLDPRAAEVTARLSGSSPSHSRTASRLPVHSSRQSSAQPSAQNSRKPSISISSARLNLSASGSIHDSYDGNQAMDLDAILAQAHAAQAAAVAVNEEEQQIRSSKSVLPPRHQAMHQRRQSERMLEVNSSQPNILDDSLLDGFDALDSEFRAPITGANTNTHAQEAGLLDGDDSVEAQYDLEYGDNIIVESLAKPAMMEESKEAEPVARTASTHNYFIDTTRPKQQSFDLLTPNSTVTPQAHDTDDLNVSNIDFEPKTPFDDDEDNQFIASLESPFDDDERTVDLAATAPMVLMSPTQTHTITADYQPEEKEDGGEAKNGKKGNGEYEVVSAMIVVEPDHLGSDLSNDVTPPTRTPAPSTAEPAHTNSGSEDRYTLPHGSDEDATENDKDETVASTSIVVETVIVEPPVHQLSHDALMVSEEDGITSTIVTRTPAPSTALPVTASTNSHRPRRSNGSIIIESPDAIISSTLVTYDVLMDDTQQEDDEDTMAETPQPRAPASTIACSNPSADSKPISTISNIDTGSLYVPSPRHSEPADEAEVEMEEKSQSGLDLSGFGDDLSLPTTPLRQSMVDTTATSLVPTMKSHSAPDIENNVSNAAAKLKEMEAARRAEQDRQLAEEAKQAALEQQRRLSLEQKEAQRVSQLAAEEQRRQQFEATAIEKQRTDDEAKLKGTLVKQWVDGVPVTKLGRKGSPRQTKVFITDDSCKTFGWQSKSKKAVQAQLSLSDCRCVIGGDDGLFVHKRFAGKFTNELSRCVSLISSQRSLDFVLERDEDVDSLVTLMKTANVKVAQH